MSWITLIYSFSIFIIAKDDNVSSCLRSLANFRHFRARKEFPVGIIAGSQFPKNIRHYINLV